MKDLFSNEYISELQTICKKAEDIIKEDIVKSISINNDFKINTIKKIENKIKHLENNNCNEDIRYRELLDIIKLLINIIKYE